MTAYNRSTSALSVDYAAQIKDRLSMFDVVYKYIPNPKITRSGDILCPFHSEKTPSFHLWDDHYNCFGCPAHGDIISFVEGLFDLDFEQALSKLNIDFGLCLPIGRKPTLREAAEAHKRYVELMRKRNEMQARRDKLDSDYDKALSEWIRLDTNYNAYKPTEPCTELHPLFAEALSLLPYYKYVLDDIMEQTYYFNQQTV